MWAYRETVIVAFTELNGAVCLLYINSAMALVLLLIIVAVIQVASSQSDICDRDKKTLRELVSDVAFLLDDSNFLLDTVKQLKKEVGIMEDEITRGYMILDI